MNNGPDFANKPVVIIGAGLAGLNCALTLKKANIDYLLLEKNQTVGGRVRTEEHEGFSLDVGFQVFQSAYPEAKAAMDYSRLDLKPLEPGAVIRLEDKWVRMSDPIRRPGQAIGTIFNPIGNLADRFKLLRMKRQICRQTIDELLSSENDCSTADYLKNRLGFSAGMFDHFLRPWLAGIFLEGELETSANYFAFVFKMLSEGDICYPRAGIQSLPNELARQLDEEKLRLNCSVTSIAPQTVVTADGQLDAAAVVLATDLTGATNLSRESVLQHTERNYRQTRCIYFATDQQPTSESALMLSGSASAGPVNHAIVLSNISTKVAPAGQHLVSVSLIGEQAAEPDMAAVRSQLKSWFGSGVDSWRELRSYHIKQALPAQPPGFYRAGAHQLSGETHRRSEGEPLICGDYCETTSVNGALKSGRLAAEHLIQVKRHVESNQTT